MTVAPAQRFFDALYANQTGVLELRTFDHPQANALRQFLMVKEGVYEFDHIARFLQGTEKFRLGAFFGVALRTALSITDRKGDAAHTQSLTALFVDADFKHLGEAETRRRIAAFPIPPSIVVCSGGGLHPYWLLEQPLFLQVGNGMQTAKSLLKRLAQAVADVVDESVSEPVRVLRIPGSFNFKAAYAEPRSVTLEQCDSTRYTISQIEDALGLNSQPELDEPPDDGGFKVPENIREGDRHEILYKFLRSQKARNVNLEVALAGCHRLNADQCKPPLDPVKLDEYLRRVWHQADSPDFELQKKFRRAGGKNGALGAIIPNNQYNIKLALSAMGITVSHNTFADEYRMQFNGYSGPLQDHIRNRVWLQIDEKFHFRPEQNFFRIVVDDLAHHNPYHPIQLYLNGLKWDGKPRIDTWLIDSASAADNEYVRTVSAMVLMAAVKRVRQPGCKFDEMLVLESSEQGLFKSSALRALCADENWFSDDLPLNVNTQQLIERTSGKWIIEASELSGMHPSRMEHLKGVLSRQVDGPVRMAYAHSPIQQPRRFIIIGTTNSHEYLHDATGNRRFWPVRVSKIDLNLIRTNRDQMWAEAAHREAKGESIRLPESLYPLAELQQERRRSVDAWENILSEVFDDHYQRLTNEDVWKALGIPVERRDERGGRRISIVMQRLGFRAASVRKDIESSGARSGKIVRGWARGRRLDHEEFHDD